MGKFKIGFLLFFITVVASAQKQGQARVDSLIQNLSQANTDKVKLRLLLDIMGTYNYFNQAKGLQYETEALEIAGRISAASVADVKNVAGRLYWRDGYFNEALRNHQDALEIFESEKNEEKIALTLRYIGQDYADAGNYSKAREHFLKALSLYTKRNDRLNMAYIYDLLNWLYGRQGNYVEASKYAYTTLKLFEEIGDQDNAALAASNIAENYIHLGNYTDALRYFKRSHSVYKLKGDRLNLGYSYALIGKACRLMGDRSLSQTYYDSAITLGRNVNDENIVANAFMGKAEVFKDLHDYAQALNWYKSASQLFKVTSNRYYLARVYNSMGECYRLNKEFEQAKKYYDSSFQISSSLDSRELFAEYYRGVEVLDSATHNWRDAYLNHKMYIVNRDSIFNQETVRRMVQLQLNYEFDRKEAIVNAEQERRDIRKRNQFIVGGIITALIFSLVIVLYRNQKRQARTNFELQQKSINLEEENREKASILDIVSHDLRAPLDKIRGLTDIMMLTDLSKEEKTQYIAHIKNSIDQGTYLIKKLSEAQTAHDSAHKPSYEMIDLPKFVYDFQFEMNSQLKNKNQFLNVKLDSIPGHVITDRNMLIRILDNLVSNASKFSEKGKSIELFFYVEGGNLKLSVKDEGPGIPENDQPQLFRKFQVLGPKPTAGESSTGLGLSITKALVEKLDGSIEVKSKPGWGTEFAITLPMRES